MFNAYHVDISNRNIGNLRHDLIQKRKASTHCQAENTKFKMLRPGKHMLSSKNHNVNQGQAFQCDTPSGNPVATMQKIHIYDVVGSGSLTM